MFGQDVVTLFCKVIIEKQLHKQKTLGITMGN